MKTPLRRLPLSGTKNTRDLGGYACGGGTVRWGAFLRSDNPANLSNEDITFLRDYGVTDVVDLRREEEAAHNPSSLVSVPGFAVHHISMQDTDFKRVDFEGDVPGSMAGLYLDMLDRGYEATAKVFRVFAAAEGCVLFHCAVGKDRTGVTALLLHKLAGVADNDAIADYAITEIYMKEVFEAQKKVFSGFELPEYIVHSLPASAERTLRHLQEKYDGAENYLRGAGVGQQELDALKQKLVLPG